MVPKRFTEPAKRAARHLPFPIVEAVAFPRESQWLRFGRKHPGADESSVVLFTLHKVASTFTNDMLGYLNDELLGLQRMDWDKYIYNKVPRDSSGYIAARSDDLFEDAGYCYGVFREALPIAQLDRYRVLLILRDPRDILTSYYFSEAHSHAPPLNKARLREFEERRSYVRSLSIDEYVLERSGHVQHKLDAYMSMSQRAGVEPLTYEHMMSDWVGFMDRVEGILGMEISEHHRQTLRLRGQIGVEHAGDVNSHRRRGTPGDYLEKLQPKTIAVLNERFDVHLKWLGLVESDEVEIDLRVTPTRTAAA